MDRRTFGLLVIILGLFGIWYSTGGHAATGSTAEPTASSAGVVATQPNTTTSTNAFFTAGTSGSVQLTDGTYGRTGEGVTQTVTVNLGAGHALVGQSYGFQGQSTGCQVWLVAGPFHGSVQVQDGEWFAFTTQSLSSSQEQSLLAQAAQKQANQHYGCNASNQHVTQVGGA